ncbi:MAG: hypothetical protein M3O46_08560, partial [Myxococcota bacterium]|nr:hypothetical protein [Myxococcota bacterium]
MGVPGGEHAPHAGTVWHVVDAVNCVAVPQQTWPPEQSPAHWQWNVAVRIGHDALLPGRHCPVIVGEMQHVFERKSHGMVPHKGAPPSPGAEPASNVPEPGAQPASTPPSVG